MFTHDLAEIKIQPLTGSIDVKSMFYDIGRYFQSILFPDQVTNDVAKGLALSGRESIIEV
jgi:hypothetical protein